MLTIRRYPVAASEKAKDDAKEMIKSIYSRNGDSIRQNILIFIHEGISKTASARSLGSFDSTKEKNPKAEPGQIRLAVYNSMFDFDTSLEGIIELTMMLGELEGDEPAKLLSRLFTHFCSNESELSHMMRNAVLDALGNSKSPYALRALLQYASYSDSERILSRLTDSLVQWDEKVESLQVPKKDKESLRTVLKKVVSREEKLAVQYG